MAKTNNEKQKNLYDRRMKAGWKRIWVPKLLVEKVEKLVGDFKDSQGAKK